MSVIVAPNNAEQKKNEQPKKEQPKKKAESK